MNAKREEPLPALRRRNVANITARGYAKEHNSGGQFERLFHRSLVKCIRESVTQSGRCSRYGRPAKETPGRWGKRRSRAARQGKRENLFQGDPVAQTSGQRARTNTPLSFSVVVTPRSSRFFMSTAGKALAPHTPSYVVRIKLQLVSEQVQQDRCVPHCSRQPLRMCQNKYKNK